MSLAAGVAVGLLYNVIDVKSPAPPIVALIGLPGMVAGEHVIPFARMVFARVTS
ncbi:DUF1427 family protein [Paraburkholderia diazotrophica]|uniref:XapX domain-containing protein n=1 Tax=Paraburkholderia diazotrophica TaxID=667676 RepID=A0A1H6SGH0_9BURK|nr:DUF1427 family protein [Paraburkholderia diazotrophica]SEI65014.1 XapX domain-containing protein [Paraburkholderia diazotrophica]